MSSYKDEMISFLNSNPDLVEEAVELAVSDKQPYSWRAAWLLWGCLDKNDKRVKNYIDKIVGGIKGKKDGHQRELIKILLLMDLKKKHEGILFDLCMDIWEQINRDPSVRITALKFLIKIMKKYPELAEEFTFITQEQFLESLSPGAKKSVSKMIVEFYSSQKMKQTVD